MAFPWLLESLSVLFLGLGCILFEREVLRMGLSLRVADLNFRELWG